MLVALCFLPLERSVFLQLNGGTNFLWKLHVFFTILFCCLNWEEQYKSCLCWKGILVYSMCPCKPFNLSLLVFIFYFWPYLVSLLMLILVTLDSSMWYSTKNLDMYLLVDFDLSQNFICWEENKNSCKSWPLQSVWQLKLRLNLKVKACCTQIQPLDESFSLKLICWTLGLFELHIST